MAFSESDSDGVLNGTTPVTLVAAPSSGRRIVREISIVNRDSVAVTVTLRKVTSGGTRQFARAILLANEAMLWEGTKVLSAATSSITAVMSAAVTTTAPDYTASWGDAS